jgi:hypothetical protein
MAFSKLQAWMEQKRKPQPTATSVQTLASKGGGKAKKQKSAATTSTDPMRHALVALGDFVEELGFDNRRTKGGLCTCILIPRSHRFAAAIKVSTDESRNEFVDQLVFGQLLQDFLRLQLPPKFAQCLHVIQKLVDADPISWERHVLLCRAAVTFDTKNDKILLWLAPRLDPILDAMSDICLHFQAIIRHGPPPKSKRERIAMTAIDATCVNTTNAPFTHQTCLSEVSFNRFFSETETDLISMLFNECIDEKEYLRARNHYPDTKLECYVKNQWLFIIIRYLPHVKMSITFHVNSAS